MTFGEFLRQMHIEKDVKLKPIADSIGVSVTYLSDILRDRRLPPDDPDRLRCLANAFHLTRCERYVMYDLAGKARSQLSPDLVSYMMRDDMEDVRLYLRQSRDGGRKPSFQDATSDTSGTCNDTALQMAMQYGAFSMQYPEILDINDVPLREQFLLWSKVFRLLWADSTADMDYNECLSMFFKAKIMHERFGKDISERNRYILFIKSLWTDFGDVPMDPETECLDTNWYWFPKGTHREDIWHWFEKTFEISIAADLMNA